MPTVAHSSLTGAELHEPKGVAAATANKMYVSNGAGSGTWKKINESENMDFSDKTKNIFGWNDIADNLYTSGSPRAISSGVRTKLTNNGAAAQTDTSRLGAIWNTGGSYFQVNDLNATYVARIQFKATAAAAAGTPYIILFETETDNGPTVISGHTQFIKGGGNINQVSYTTLLYLGSFINNTQLSIYVTPDTNINLYDIGFVIQRTYKES